MIAATGPSLTQEQADLCQEIKRVRRQAGSDLRIIAVNDAYRLFPFADYLYSCDARWWDAHKGCMDFGGEKWSSHSFKGSGVYDDKRAAATSYNLNLVTGTSDPGFSFAEDKIHYGMNSGFQAVNLGLLLGGNPLVLIGFDMRATDKRHFFGDHPKGLKQTRNYDNFIQCFRQAAKRLPDHLKIWNATPNSALDCFPKVDLHVALAA